jgi:hypothetical protein
MIKKNQIEVSDEQKMVRHIISSLYKIKAINRKKEQDKWFLKQQVLHHYIGTKAINELYDLNITRKKLTEYGCHYFNEIMGDLFPDH